MKKSRIVWVFLTLACLMLYSGVAFGGVVPKASAPAVQKKALQKRQFVPQKIQKKAVPAASTQGVSRFQSKDSGLVKSAGPTAMEKLKLIGNVQKEKLDVRSLSRGNFKTGAEIIQGNVQTSLKAGESINGMITDVVVDASSGKIWFLGKMVEGTFVSTLNVGAVMGDDKDPDIIDDDDSGSGGGGGSGGGSDPDIIDDDDDDSGSGGSGGGGKPKDPDIIDDPIPFSYASFSREGVQIVDLFLAGANSFSITVTVDGVGRQAVSLFPTTGGESGGPGVDPLAANVWYCPEGPPRPNFGTTSGAAGQAMRSMCGSDGEPIPLPHD